MARFSLYIERETFEIDTCVYFVSKIVYAYSAFYLNFYSFGMHITILVDPLVSTTGIGVKCI